MPVPPPSLSPPLRTLGAKTRVARPSGESPCPHPRGVSRGPTTPLLIRSEHVSRTPRGPPRPAAIADPNSSHLVRPGAQEAAQTPAAQGIRRGRCSGRRIRQASAQEAAAQASWSSCGHRRHVGFGARGQRLPRGLGRAEHHARARAGRVEALPGRWRYWCGQPLLARRYGRLGVGCALARLVRRGVGVR